MTIEVNVEGAGELGEIAPGWSVQEYATPIVIGETSGGTGQVSLTASAKPTSLFVVNNNIVTVDDSLGEVTGVVKSVSQTGSSVNVTHGTALAIFDANFDIPALGAGGMLPVMDLASQLSGRDKLCVPSDGYFYSLQGHSAGFDILGDVAKPVYTDGSYTAYDNSTGQFYPVYYRQQYGSIWASTFTVDSGKVYATTIAGDHFSNEEAINTSRLAFKTKLDAPLSWAFEALPDDSNFGSGQEITISCTTAGVLTASGRYRAGGMVQDFLQSADLSLSLDVTQELVFFIQYQRPHSGNLYNLNIRICNADNYAIFVEINQDFTADISYWNNNWNASGQIRALYRHQGFDLGAWAPAEYENPVTYLVSVPIAVGNPVAAQPASNLWEYMQQACAFFQNEIAAINGTVVVRDIDTIPIDVDNHTPITVTPTIALSGRNVEIVYSNSKHVSNAELYNAREDDNRVISVKASETVKTTVTVAGTIASVNLPSYSSSPIAGVGQYKISDAKGNPVPIRLWNNFGGRLRVDTVDGVPNAIEVTFIGPTSTTGEFNEVSGDPSKPLYPGPYKLAYTADGTDYAALSITGSGILSTEETLKLRTAADPDKTAQDVAKTIKNPFVNTLAEAYDRGLPAAVEASGPRVTITGTLPVSAVYGFGFTAGSRIYYLDSIYRVTEATIGVLGVSFTATRHVTVGDFDSFWNGRTVGTHDLLWEGFDASDHSIRPLWFIGDDEPVVLMLDEDFNPYYTFIGQPEISVFFDTDGVPYYVEGDLENAEPVYLDVDENPYV